MCRPFALEKAMKIVVSSQKMVRKTLSSDVRRKRMRNSDPPHDFDPSEKLPTERHHGRNERHFASPHRPKWLASITVLPRADQSAWWTIAHVV